MILFWLVQAILPVVPVTVTKPRPAYWMASQEQYSPPVITHIQMGLTLNSLIVMSHPGDVTKRARIHPQETTTIIPKEQQVTIIISARLQASLIKVITAMT